MSVLTVGRPRRARRVAFTASALIGVSLGSLANGPPALAALGVGTSIDASFGGGLVKTSLSPVSDEAFAVAVQPDGATVVAGQTNLGFAPIASNLFVSRYTSAGQLDSGFGQGGTFVLGTVPSVQPDNAFVLAIQPDGKIVVGGQREGNAVVVRLTRAGALDPDFQGGVVTFAEATAGSAWAVAVQPDGSIRVGGTANRTIFQARLNADGSRDTTFAPTGLVVGDAPAGWSVTTMAFETGGKLLAGGGGEYITVLLRYLPSGGLDPGFGAGGVVTIRGVTDFVDWSTRIKGLAVQPDGRILAVGEQFMWGFQPYRPPKPGSSPPSPTYLQHTSYGNVALHRFLPDGQPDTSFSVTGKVVTRVPGQPGPGSKVSGASTLPMSTSSAKAIALAPDGSIMVAGLSSQPLTEGTLLRYTPSGLLDATFGQAGVLDLEMGGPQSVVNAIAFHADGRLAIAGATMPKPSDNSFPRDVLVARVIPGSNAGVVWTWGWNGLGQLGDGTTIDRPAPVYVPGLSGIVAVSASPYHSLALRGDGTVWAWGWNAVGQLGDGTTVSRLSPVRVPGLTGVVAVAAGGLHSLALRGDGTVWAWGYNGQGQLGDGTTTMRLTPTRTLLTGITAISAGLFHNLAIREEGTAWAWGYNGQGQIGDGTFIDRASPVALYGTIESFERISAGWLHSAAVGSSFTGFLWGYDQLGQVSGSAAPNFPYPDNKLGPTVDVAAGGYHTVSSREGVVSSRGWNAYGQLGREPNLLSVITGLPTWSSVSAGGLHNLAVTPDHRLLAWGWNYYGQLGTGSRTTAAAPTAIAFVNPVTISAGGYHSMAVQG